ncbi:hypothetical protein [Streptomyces boninensis]|uniref:hypothetical protein n=1 Tax=Streptomyces boninensis TaxID=2039455 RepID=UPI003B210499
MTALYNLDYVHRTLAPSLIGLEAEDEAWVDSPFPAGNPVVELTGDRASGKTRLLRMLHEAYRDLVPTVYADLGQAPYSASELEERERLDQRHSSPVTNVLYALIRRLDGQQLARQGRGGQTLEFRRVSTALYVVSAWRRSEADEDEADFELPDQLIEAEAELQQKLRLLREGTVSERDELVRAAVDAWLAAAGQILGHIVPVPAVGDILTAAQQTLRAWSAGKGGDDHKWWGERLPGLDPPIRKLFDLAQQFRSVGDQREAAEHHLIAAFLADIDAAYGRRLRKSRHPPLILLDNIDDELRKRWLRPCSGLFGTQHGRRRTMNPTVLATSLGSGSAGSLTPATRTEPWRSPDLAPPVTWLLRFGIPAVSADDIENMLRDHGYDTTADRAAEVITARLKTLIGRLSGGRTGNALVLAAAAAGWLADGLPADELPGRLLDLPAPGARGDDVPTVAEQLLLDLLPDPALRELAPQAAAALDESAATWLLLGRAPHERGADAAAPEVRIAALRRDHWRRAPWPKELGRGPLITDRALRTVLLHRLRGAGSQVWHNIHDVLGGHYDADAGLTPAPPLAVSPHAFRLHHALARGELDSTVMPALHRLYAKRPPAQVLREINIIAAAPDGPSTPAPRPPGPGPQCAECKDHGTREVHDALRTLVECVRELSSPLAPKPTRGSTETDLLRRLLHTLASGVSADRQHTSMINAYSHAKSGWENALVHGKQAPDLPVHDGGR